MDDYCVPETDIYDDGFFEAYDRAEMRGEASEDADSPASDAHWHDVEVLTPVILATDAELIDF